MQPVTTRRTTYITIATIVLALGFIAWDIPLWLGDSKTTNANYAINIYYASFYVLAAVFCLMAARRVTIAASAFRFWGIALLAWAGGLFAWSYYNIVAKQEIPFPSAADVGFLLFLPLMAYGTWRMQSAYRAKNRQPLIASIPLVIISMLLVFFVFNRPDLSTDLSLLTRFINFSYSLGDGLLLSMTLVALQGAASSGAKKHFYLLIAGLLMLTIGDFTFYFTTSHETYWNGYFPDIFYAAFPLIFVNGVVRAEVYLANQQTLTSSAPILPPNPGAPTPTS